MVSAALQTGNEGPHEIASILATGYLRYRNRLTCERARESAPAAQIPLDDVVHEAPLVPEPKGLCDGGNDHEG